MTLFDHDTAARAMFDCLSKGYDEAAYEKIINQAAIDPHFKWGNGLKTLLISDRALKRAEGLFIYLTKKTDFQCIKLCKNIDQIYDYLNCVTPDIIIFIGMAYKKANYKAISIAKKANEFVMAAMFASIDYEIKFVCQQNCINYAFSSNKPIREGLLYLQKSFEENVDIIQMKIDERIRKEENNMKAKIHQSWL